MKTKKNKWLRNMLAVVMALALLPNISFAAETDNIGTIEMITAGGTAEGNNITVTGSNLNWVEKDVSVGRNQDGWWIGVKISAPASVDTDEKANQVKYSNNGSDNLEKNFGQNKDGQWWMGCWVPVKPDSLEQALENNTALQWTYKFDWDGNGTVDQTFMITVDPDNITLNKDGEVFCKTEDGVMSVKDGQHVHSYGTAWKSDATNHWHECAACDEVADKAEHTYETWTTTKPATETEAGEKERSCSVCGYKETAEIPVLTHTPIEEDPKPVEVEKPAVEDKGSAAVAGPHTGDSSNVGLCITLMVLSCAGMTGMLLSRRRKKITEIPLIKL